MQKIPVFILQSYELDVIKRVLDLVRCESYYCRPAVLVIEIVRLVE